VSAQPAHNCPDVQVRHFRVYQDHVWAQRVGSANGLGLMTGFREHKQVQLEREARDQRPSNEWRVLDEKQGDHL
jgi:hypothetical protein